MTTTTIIGTLFLILGAGLFVGVTWLFSLARASRNWTSTQGQVVASKVESTFESTGSNRMNHRLVLTYSYSVDGQLLTGHRIQFGDAFWGSSRSREVAEALHRKYAEGQGVAVFYDPMRPQRCTLTRNVEARPYYTLFAVALGLLLAGVAILIGLIRVL